MGPGGGMQGMQQDEVLMSLNENNVVQFLMMNHDMLDKEDATNVEKKGKILARDLLIGIPIGIFLNV